MFLIKNLTRTHIQALLAIFITIVIAWISIHESQAYYNVASFHYDSSAYIYYALQDYNSIHEHGRLFSLIQSLKNPDSLDITLRILFAPKMLKSMYGHMVISLPFMALFIFLIFNYVFKRTESWLSSMIAALFIFAFPIIYSPYMGIADYWKESVAIWILGCAFMSWLLSDLLNKPRWSALSGILLGLLVMERAALSVYAAQLFLPLFAYACYIRLFKDTQKTDLLQRKRPNTGQNESTIGSSVNASKKQALKKIAIFATPALLISSLMVIMKWQWYYNYYFKVGYSYASPKLIFNMLRDGTPRGIGYSFSKLGYFFGSCCALAGKDCLNKDVFMALWTVIGFPLIVIFSHSNYHSVYNVSILFLIILFVTLVPRRPQSLLKQIGSWALLVSIILVSINQYRTTAKITNAMMIKNAPWRVLYGKITDIIESQPLPHRYTFLFDEQECLFTNYLKFNRKMSSNNIKSIGFMSVHDSYYQHPLHVQHGQTLAQQIAENNINLLESTPDVIAFAYCDPTAVKKSQAFNGDAKKIAIPVASMQASYLLQSLHWKIISKLDSPLGCLYAYKYSKNKLTQTEKWKDMVVRAS